MYGSQVVIKAQTSLYALFRTTIFIDFVIILLLVLV